MTQEVLEVGLHNAPKGETEFEAEFEIYHDPQLSPLR
jgi:hypothetical protein